MEFRKLGETGLEVSELGLGGHEYRRMLSSHHFPDSEISENEFKETQPRKNNIIKTAIESGINYFDTTIPREAKSLGNALEALGLREEVVIAAAIMNPFGKLEGNTKSEWAGSFRKMIVERLNFLKTEYIDIFNVHFPEYDYSKDKMRTFLDVLEEMEEEDRVRAIGASSHEPRFLANLIKEFDRFDSVMVPYNYFFQRARETLFPICADRNKGIVVMKPLVWPYYGIPFMKFCPENADTTGYTPAQTSIKWILESPEVSTVITAVNSINELEENLATLDKNGAVNEDLLDKSLNTALSPKGREILRDLTDHPAKDISNYAEKSLASPYSYQYGE